MATAEHLRAQADHGDLVVARGQPGGLDVDQGDLLAGRVLQGEDDLEERGAAHVALGRELAWSTDDIALQNIQARVRAPGVWMIANLRNALLLATSNRSEAAVGYATMDGDTCGGVSPIAGIDKAFLRQWLRFMESDGPHGLGPTPDSPLIFAWTGAIWAVWRLSQTGDGRWWFAAGGFIGLSMLGKYSGVLLGPVVLLYLLTSPRQRHWFGKPQPYLAVGVAIAVFAPVLIWNAQHDWVSLAFQSSRRVGEMGGFKPRYFLMLVATQFLLLTPYLFVVAIGALIRGARGGLGASVDDRTRLLLLSGAVPILVFTFVSFRSIAKINWLAPAYWSLMILGVQYVLTREGGLRRLLRGLASSAILLLAAGLVFWIPNLPVPGDMNSWSGWQEAATRVAKAEASLRAEGRETFVFGPNYKISSLMRYYLPGQPRTYAHDIGQKLGCGAHLSALRRTRSGHFKLLPGKHVTFDMLKEGKRDEVLASMLTLYDVSKLRGA